MNRMKRWARGCGATAALALICSAVALAADPPKTTAADPAPETRRQMAAAHRKMADCLESTRPFGECRTEMMKTCHDLMGEQGCPMMGPMGPGMKHGHGMMHGNPSEKKSKP